MKKLFYMLVAVATLSMTSCSDLLDEVNYGNPTIGEMMGNEETAVLMFGQSYADLKWVHDHWGYWGVNTLTADEGLCPVRMPGEHWSDGGYWKRLNTHTWNAFADAFRNIWNTTISGAVNCNQLIQTFTDNKDNMSEKAYATYVGELEVLRSYYYYLLFDCFGRIPYIEEYIEKSEPLMEPHLVWSYLVSCLERNALNLPVVDDGNRANYYGRVTQGFAYGLLARLYLNAESFGCTLDNVFPSDIFVTEIPVLPENATEEEKAANAKLRLLPANWDNTSFYKNCVRCCDAVIESGSYKIEPNYFNNFLINNEASKENMFVIVEDGRADFDHRYNGSMSNKFRGILLTLHYSHQSTWGMIEKPWNGFCARPEFMELYNDNDVRGAGNEYTTDSEGAREYAGTKRTKDWGWFVGPVYDAKGENLVADENGSTDAVRVEVKSLDEANWWDGARLTKYEVDKSGAYAYAENDFVLMRYADVLWMREEAILRGATGDASGFNSGDFVTLKKRAFAYGGTTFEEAYGSTPTLEMILDERGREFAWELVRRRDLIRYDEYGKIQYCGNKSETRNWFPIPYSVLEKSPRDENNEAIWTQNEGY